MPIRKNEIINMKIKPGSLIGIWVVGIFAGGLVGAITNSLSSQISPQYFRTVMNWHNVSGITQAIIAQGIFEGIICGLVLSTIFTIIVGIVSKAACPFVLGIRYVDHIFLLALVCWVVGGLIGVLLASLSSEFYAHTFRGVPQEAVSRLCFAWVGGSIWGIQFGGAAVTLVIGVLFRAGWRNIEESQVPQHLKCTETCNEIFSDSAEEQHGQEA
jgi:hypothetical protein